MAAKQSMKTVDVLIDKLVLDDRNARKGNVVEIIASLQEFGQHRPVVVQTDTNKVIAGNHLVMAAESLGWSKIACVYVDDDDTTALRRSLADNLVNDRATWDDHLLRELIAETGLVPGLDVEDFDDIMAEDLDDEPDTQPIFPIAARINEEYEYVVVVADNAVDANYLREKFDLRMERSYKSSKIKTSHVVTVERLRELWT